LGSDYCLKELGWFRESAQQQRWGMKIADRPRCANVLLYNLRPDKWPEELKGQVGLPIHNAIRDDDEGDPLQPDEPRFTEQMRKLSKAVFNTLQHFKETIESDRAKKAAAPSVAVADHQDHEAEEDGRPIVFLADVAESLEIRRVSVARELSNKGIKVVNRIPPPYELTAHEQEAVKQISIADLAVHLFDKNPGRKFDDHSLNSYAQLQVELGLQQAKSQLIWVPPALNADAITRIEDVAHRGLLSRLENGDRDQSRYRFVRESPSAIAREVINQLKQLEEMERQRKMQLDTASALIDTHLKDQFKALALGRAIEENSWQPFINPSVDDPALSAQILADRLKKVSKLIVLFGEVAQAWVDGRLREALRVAANTPNCPLKKFAVCFALPQRKEIGIRFDLGFVPVHHFNLEELLDPATLAEFLKS
ncbi:MAG: hypothetical protein M3X11_23040, partial [Acidobacteriota bacterium]|nr:hypothetical protein [Acidobacteriota bacterium]